MKSVGSIFVITFLVLLSFLLTKYPVFSGLKLHVTILAIVIVLLYMLVLKIKKAKYSRASFVYAVTFMVLMLVGATGWFYSPFFFSLYLIAIVLSFLFNVGASLAFILLLVTLFSFNVGDVDITYDLLVIVSLVTIIPLTLYLRRAYLKYKQDEKEILVLHEQQKHLENIVEDVLSNKVHNFSTVLRESINDAKTMAYHMEDIDSKTGREEQRKNIIKTTEKALALLKTFEEETTGNKLLSTRSTKP